MGEEEDGEAGTFVDIITRTGGTPYLIIANTAMIYALSHGHSNYKERKVANPPQADLNIAVQISGVAVGEMSGAAPRRYSSAGQGGTIWSYVPLQSALRSSVLHVEWRV